MDTVIPTAAPGLPNLTRRRVLAAAPLLGLAAAPALAPVPSEDDTARLIAAYHSAKAAFEAAARAWDCAFLGSRPTMEEMALCDDTQVKFCEAEEALCRYASPTLAGNKARIALIAAEYSKGGFGGPECFDALLGSIGQMVAA